jgi:hypothetical protein
LPPSGTCPPLNRRLDVDLDAVVDFWNHKTEANEVWRRAAWSNGEIRTRRARRFRRPANHSLFTRKLHGRVLDAGFFAGVSSNTEAPSPFALRPAQYMRKESKPSPAIRAAAPGLMVMMAFR